MKNLDLLAQKTCQAIVKQVTQNGKVASELDGVATKTIGVLQENGVYAGILFLYTRPKAELSVSEAIRNHLIEVAQELLSTGEKAVPADNSFDTLTHVSLKICSDLESLMLVKQVWEQSLVYTRYAAKASKKKES